MKNFTYIFLLLSFTLLVSVYGQQDAVGENIEQNQTVEADKDMKIKFGSKEHRSKLETKPGKIESTENILLKTCLALAAVIGVILILFSIVKKVNGRIGNTGTDNPLRIKNKMMIDSKNYLALVRVYEEEILISVGPNGTSMLAKYALVDKEEAEGTDFESVLNSEGKSVVPISPENHVNSIDLKSIRELKSEKE